jgi:excisionase family DNA binding protein
MDQLLVPVWPDAAQVLGGLGRTKIFELVASGELPSVRVGRRRLVRADALREFAERLAS